MSREVPEALRTHRNSRVLAFSANLSAHSDITQAFGEALKPLGDVQRHGSRPTSHGCEIASTGGTIFSFAYGMNAVAFRLDDRMKVRALASGAEAIPECGPEWVTFTLFRDDWPRVDLEFAARKAYVSARE